MNEAAIVLLLQTIVGNQEEAAKTLHRIVVLLEDIARLLSNLDKEVEVLMRDASE